MVDDIESITKEILNELGPLSSNVLMEKVKNKAGKSYNVILKRWKKMYVAEDLYRYPKKPLERWREDKQVFYYLNGQEEKIEKLILGKKGGGLTASGEQQIIYNLGEKHTQMIINEVIVPWIEEIPVITETGVYTKFWKNPNTEQILPKGKLMMDIPVADELRLFIEDHPYFEHLKKYHVSNTVNPFDLLEDLKEKTQSYLKEILDLEQMISGAIEEIIGLEICIREPKTGDWKPGTIHRDFVDHIYSIAFILGEKGKDFLNFDKDTLISHNFRGMEECDLPGTGKYHWSWSKCAWVNFGERSKEQVCEEMNGKILLLHKELITKPFLEKERKVAELCKTLKNIVKEMKDALIEHKGKTILDGTCNELIHQSKLYSDSG